MAVGMGFAVLVAMVGCSTDDSPGDPEDSPGLSEPEGSPGTSEAALVGTADSECPMPLSFEVADSWEPAAVTVDAEQGGLAAVCEIDAKPAGMLGYIRVWIGDPGTGDLQAALDGFLNDDGGEIEEPQYEETSIGDVAGIDVAYVRYLATLDERKQEQAFAVPVQDEVAVVTVSGLDSEEYEAMLPAYELARDSVQITG